MRRIRFTPAAEQDLSEIWDFTEGRWGGLQAEASVTEIWSAVERIADDPARGRACDEIRPGYRRYVVGSHVVFYRGTADTVDVVRILHGRRDPPRHL